MRDRAEYFEPSSERIYAVCSRKVRLQTTKRVFDSVGLGKDNVWTSYQATRSSPTETSANIDEGSQGDGEGEHTVRTWELGNEEDVFEALDPN